MMKYVLTLLQRDNLVYLVAAITSMVLSHWISSHEIVINPDAICYLHSAEEVGKGGLRAAMHSCPQAIWPFYSALIYAVSLVTPFDLTNAAFFLDSLFSALSVVMFIAIVQALGGTRRVLWFAAIVILLSHQFNNVRQYIIRDHGFWAFYLISIYSLIQFVRDKSLKTALLWSGSLVVATLFRLEGAVFFLVVPWLVWLDVQQSWLTRVRLFLTLNVLTIVIGLGLGAWFALHPQQTIDQLGRLLEIKYQVQHGLASVITKYQHMSIQVTSHVLSAASARDAEKVVFLTGIIWYLLEVVNNVSWIYAGLVLFAWFTKAAPFSKSHRLIVVGYLVINVLITFAFFAQYLFLAKRYLIALTFVLMLWVPFALEKLLSRRWIFAIVMLLIFSTSTGGIFHFGTSKQYIRDAGDWLAGNVPPTQTVYVNDYQLMYYSKHFEGDIFNKINTYKDISTIAHGKWKRFNYLAIQLDHEKGQAVAEVMQELHFPPIIVFVSDRGDKIFIYKVRH